MDTQQLELACRQSGIAPQALLEVTAKVQAHFGDSTPKPAALTAYLTGLQVWEKLGMSQQEFYGMPATWRVAQGWAHQPPPVSRRPDTRILTAEELQALKGLAWAEYLTRGRQMQQTPLEPSTDEA